MQIWAWGSNSNGQLGLDYKSEQEERPIEIVNSVSQDLVPIKVVGGAFNTVVLVMKKCGDQENYNGYGTWRVTDSFYVVESSAFNDVQVGWDFNLGIRGQCMTLYSSGTTRNLYGQLGIGLVEWKNGKEAGPWDLNCQEESMQCKIQFSTISASVRICAAISIDHKPYFWGDNTKGFFSLSNCCEKRRVYSPTTLDVDEKDAIFSKIRCGKNFIIALGNDGSLYGCGQNRFGVLCEEVDCIKTKLARIWKPQNNEAIKDIQCGWTHVLALTESGMIYSWGRNNFFQLGRRVDNYCYQPNKVVTEEPMKAIACGSEHNLALGHSGKVYSWGWNEHYNCGMPSIPENSETVPIPTLVVSKEGEPLLVSVIGCGNGSSFAISSS